MAAAIAIAYALAAGAWILISDSVLSMVLSKPEHLYAASVAKGFLFVAVTSGLLFLLLYKAFARLAQNRAELASVTEYAYDNISILSADLRFVYANPALCRAIGYSWRELNRMPVEAVLTEDGKSRVPAHLARLAREPYSRDVWRVRRRDGSLLTLEVCTQRLPDGRFLAIGHDVADRLQAERELLERVALQERMSKIAASVPGVICSLQRHPDGRLTFPFASPAMTETSGFTPEQAACDAGPIFANTHPEDAEGLIRSIVESAETFSPWEGEWRYRHPTKGLRWMHGRSLPQQDVDGSVVWHGFVMDITERREAESALRASETFNRIVLDSSVSQVAVLNAEGTIVAINEAWRRFARENSDCQAQLQRTGVGTDFLEVCRRGMGTQADNAMAAAAGIQDVLEGRTRHFTLDCPCDTETCRRWFSMNVTPLANGTAGALVSYFDITEIRRAQALQDRATEELKALAKKHLSIQEEERRAISREIHDHIGQALTALQFNLVAAQHHFREPEWALPKLEAAIHVIDSLMAATRDLSRRLRPPMLDDLGLAAAVRWHLDKLPAPEPVRLEFHQDIDSERFPPTVELAAFRVVQEAVANCLRHAKATEIVVNLRRNRDGLLVSIGDDGIGFDTTDSRRDTPYLPSLGLIGMRERVAAKGGQFSVDSRPGFGTEIRASFPLSVAP